MNVTSTIVWVTQILAQHSTSTIVIGYDTIPIRHNINAMSPTLNLLPLHPLLLLLAYEVVMAAMVQEHKKEPVVALLNLEREAQMRAVQRHQQHYEKALSMAIKSKLNISFFDLDRCTCRCSTVRCCCSSCHLISCAHHTHTHTHTLNFILHPHPHLHQASPPAVV